MKIFYCICISIAISATAIAQAPLKKPVSISGSMGATYEGYGLNIDPNSPFFYGPRRPWNQFRIKFAPIIKIGKNFSLPVNIHFATKPTNFLGPYAGITTLGKQSFKQWLTNPLNNFSLNPRYKWAELQLGTQYLNYSELSTGDIGIFGVGFDLKPKHYLFKFFTGNSQQGVNYAALPLPGTPGAYRRSHWMAQIGKEEEGRYKLAFNFAKSRDYFNSASPPPPLLNPHENFVTSFLADVYFKKGYYFKTELAQSIYTPNNITLFPPPPGVKSFLPFIKSKAGTNKDYAATAAIGKKSKNFDIGFNTRYLGAGYQTLGYPFQQSDKLDLTLNTRFNAWKDSSTGSYKMNVIANIGKRVNNYNIGPRSNQFIGMINWFTQFNPHFSINLSFNNFGFNTNGVSLGTATIKNVSNDFGFNPTYTWNNTKMSHLLSLSYNYSKYKETVALPLAYIPSLTNNKTHTALLTYVPTYFTRKISPDFSLMYFQNDINPGFKLQLASLSAGLAAPFLKDKLKWRGQLQYTIGKVASFTKNNNVIASMTADYNLSKKVNWNTFLSTNYFKYGNELSITALVGANYLESTVRTGFTYKWK